MHSESKDTWNTARGRFQSEIEDANDFRRAFEVKTAETFRGVIAALPLLQTGIKNPKISLPRFEQLLVRAKPFVGFLETFNFEPSPSFLIWGCLSLILKHGENNSQAMAEILTMLEENIDVLPRNSIPTALWMHSESLRSAFWDLYTELICLFASIIVSLRRNRSSKST